MLEENLNTRPSCAQYEDLLLANVYKNKLVRCGVSKREAERLAATCAIEELKDIATKLKASTGYRPASSDDEKRTGSEIAVTQASNGNCRVWSIRPSANNRHLCCSRKRTKVEKALGASQSISRESDPLKHLGYLDDEMKHSHLDKLIENHLTHNSRGQEGNQDTH